ncbi:unnamed protein product [Allacma fusca]|uniref:GH16 domain-containing protein n=1 Tax=Allacma fusca TaxID=39272 RepID=A0A8J2PXG6_9HEXA|nr:unnamed protein product [Allacma fusca]
MYDNSRTNSYADKGHMYIKPTLSTDQYGEHGIFHGEITLDGTLPIDSCTNPKNLGCKRIGNYPKSIVNPTISAKIRTVHSFYFQYGRVHVRAKIPSGDWTWPSISLLPRFNKYGPWPASGEIRLMESRGNVILVDENGKDIGSNRITSALHFGPYFPYNGYENALIERVHRSGFDEKFHLYSVEWTPDNITFFLDDVPTKVITPPEGGFWELGGFDRSVPNPWENSDNQRMAPFDQKYFLALNVAVGGTGGHFPDTALNGPNKKRKPWVNANSQSSFLTFYNARREWYPTWADDKAALIIDYIEIYAI